MDHQQLQYLFEKYFDKTASAQDRKALDDLLRDDTNREEVMQLFTATWEKYQGDGKIIEPERSDEILQTIFGRVRKNKDEIIVREIGSPRRIPWGRIAAAAIVIIMIGAGGYFYFNKKQPGH